MALSLCTQVSKQKIDPKSSRFIFFTALPYTTSLNYDVFEPFFFIRGLICWNLSFCEAKVYLNFALKGHERSNPGNNLGRGAESFCSCMGQVHELDGLNSERNKRRVYEAADSFNNLLGYLRVNQHLKVYYPGREYSNSLFSVA